MTKSAHHALQDERYLILETLGRGGMASVYRAYDRFERRTVALKVPTDDGVCGPSHPLSLEYEAWSRFEHPNIVRVYALARSRRGPFGKGRPYLILEDVGGGTLDRVFRAGRLPPTQLESLAVSLLKGLEQVHDAGLVHRDLKPSNVLVAPCGHPTAVKLSDFGLATHRGEADEPGTISGSLPYVAPEGLLGLPIDARADLYGLGILLYQMSTGELPAPGASADTLLRWHLNGRPPDPRRVRPRLPERLARFIRRLTARDRAERPRHAAEALEDLGCPVRSSCSSSPSPVHRGEQARLRLALDAARLGAMRLHRLPRQTDIRRPMVRQVRVWAEIQGIEHLRLEQPSVLCAARMALRLIARGGSESVALVRELALARWLPLELVGNHVVLDGSRTEGPSKTTVAVAAAGLTQLLMSCSIRRPLILEVAPRATAEPLIRHLVHGLAARCGSRDRPDRGRGGLLLLL